MSTPNLNVLLGGSISQFNNLDASSPLLSQLILNASIGAKSTYYDPFFQVPLVGNVAVPIPPGSLVFFAYIKCVDPQTNAFIQIQGLFHSGAPILVNLSGDGFWLFWAGNNALALPNIDSMTISGGGSGVTNPVLVEIFLAGL